MMLHFGRVTILCIGVAAALVFGWQMTIASADDAPWRAGVARVNITPELPIWLSGYGARNKSGTEKLDDLWAKALVLQDLEGRRAVLVTLDLVGIDRGLSVEVCRRIEEKYKLSRAAIALCTSHTHSGPVMRGNLVPMYDLDEDQARRVKEYAEQLKEKLVTLVGEAIRELEPASLSWGVGTATFAVNRRNNPEGQVVKLRASDQLKGPVDHDVPVLAVHDGEGELQAVVMGYACHATVLAGYAISADWPGAAQNEIERRHPGVTALFWAGCGADQNPLPRRSVALMHEYGRQMAEAVDATLGQPLKPIKPSIDVAYREIALPFDTLPTRGELELTASAERPQGPWAKYLLSVWERDGELARTYPYPVQAWRLGEEIDWIFLGGEVVVDYALRLKSELAPAVRGSHDHAQSGSVGRPAITKSTTWIASYSNDVMGYIPSRRVLAEGGYEGGGARFPYGLPAVWAPSVEQQIIDAVHAIVSRSTPPPQD